MTTNAAEARVAALLVEDNRVEARRLLRLLEEINPPVEAVHVGDLAAALAQVAQRDFQVILLDLVLPDSTDLRTVRRMRMHALHVPIVVLTNLDDRSLALAALREGAQDFLPKATVSAEGLARAIRYAGERFETQHRLEAAERRFRRALSVTCDAVWLVDGDERVVQVNEALCRLLHREAHAIVGQPYASFVAAEDAPHLREFLAEMRDTGSSRYVVRLRRADGSAVPVEVTAVDLGDGAMLGTCRDMTHWVETREALSASEARYAGVVATTSEAILSVNPHGRVVLFNHAAERLFLTPASRALGQPLDAFLPPEACAEPARGAGTGRGPVTVRAQRADGHPIRVQATVTSFEVGADRYRTAVVRDVTAWEETQEQMRAVTERFRAVAEGSLDLLTELDEEGRLCWVSASVTAVLGYRPEDLVGHNVAEFVFAADLGEVKDAQRTLREQQQPARGRWRLRAQNGTWRWFEGTNTPFVTAHGERRILAINRDISALMESLERLDESESRYRMLLDAAPDPVWILSDSQHLTYANAAACRLFGQERPQLLDRALADLVAEGAEAVRGAVGAALTGGIGDVVAPVRRPGGEFVHVEMHIVNLGNGACQVAARDVTGWLSAESARTASEARYRQALDAATEGVWLLDRDLTLRYANRRGAHFLGAPPGVTDLPLLRFLPANAHDTLRAALAALDNRGEHEWVLPVQRPDGVTVVVHVSGVAIADGYQAFVREAA